MKKTTTKFDQLKWTKSKVGGKAKHQAKGRGERSYLIEEGTHFFHTFFEKKGEKLTGTRTPTGTLEEAKAVAQKHHEMLQKIGRDIVARCAQKGFILKKR